MRLFVFLLFAYTSVVYAQSDKVLFSNQLSEDSLRSYLYVLTSDSLEGRETGRPGQQKAAAFLAGHHRKYGLGPAGTREYFQPHYLSIRSSKGKTFTIGDKQFLYGKDFHYCGGYRDTLFVLNEILFFRDEGGLISNPSLIRKNDIVLLGNREKKTINIDEIRQLIPPAQQPAALFVVSDSVSSQLVTKSYPHCGGSYPVILLSDSMANAFFRDHRKDYFSYVNRRAKKKKVGVRIGIQGTLPFYGDSTGLTGANVISFIKGRELRDEVVVISAHYDHLGIRDSLMYKGADDDASGTSAVMEMARIFAMARDNGHGPRRSIAFIHFSGEEKGLLGSAFYAQHPSFPFENTVANLNIDMIGRTDRHYDSLGIRDYVYLIGSDKLSNELRAINEQQNSAYTKLELNYKYDDPGDPNRYYRRSDHFNFARNNVPVIFYFNGTHDDYHLPGDTPDKIQFDLLLKRTRLIFLTAWELANREERPKLNEPH